MGTQEDRKDPQEAQRRPMVVVPDDYAKEDGIGYAHHVEVLVRMIRSVKSDGSFTIGVFGDWGQGKTSVLRQVKRRLDGVSAPPGDDGGQARDSERNNEADPVLTVCSTRGSSPARNT